MKKMKFKFYNNASLRLFLFSICCILPLGAFAQNKKTTTVETEKVNNPYRHLGSKTGIDFAADYNFRIKPQLHDALCTIENSGFYDCYINEVMEEEKKKQMHEPQIHAKGETPKSEVNPENHEKTHKEGSADENADEEMYVEAQPDKGAITDCKSAYLNLASLQAQQLGLVNGREKNPLRNLMMAHDYLTSQLALYGGMMKLKGDVDTLFKGDNVRPNFAQYSQIENFNTRFEKAESSIHSGSAISESLKPQNEDFLKDIFSDQSIFEGPKTQEQKTELLYKKMSKTHCAPEKLVEAPSLEKICKGLKETNPSNKETCPLTDYLVVLEERKRLFNNDVGKMLEQQRIDQEGFNVVFEFGEESVNKTIKPQVEKLLNKKEECDSKAKKEKEKCLAEYTLIQEEFEGKFFEDISLSYNLMTSIIPKNETNPSLAVLSALTGDIPNGKFDEQALYNKLIKSPYKSNENGAMTKTDKENFFGKPIHQLMQEAYVSLSPRLDQGMQTHNKKIEANFLQYDLSMDNIMYFLDHTKKNNILADNEAFQNMIVESCTPFSHDEELSEITGKSQHSLKNLGKIQNCAQKILCNFCDSEKHKATCPSGGSGEDQHPLVCSKASELDSIAKDKQDVLKKYPEMRKSFEQNLLDELAKLPGFCGSYFSNIKSFDLPDKEKELYTQVYKCVHEAYPSWKDKFNALKKQLSDIDEEIADIKSNSKYNELEIAKSLVITEYLDPNNCNPLANEDGPQTLCGNYSLYHFSSNDLLGGIEEMSLFLDKKISKDKSKEQRRKFLSENCSKKAGPQSPSIQSLCLTLEGQKNSGKQNTPTGKRLDSNNEDTPNSPSSNWQNKNQRDNGKDNNQDPNGTARVKTEKELRQERIDAYRAKQKEERQNRNLEDTAGYNMLLGVQSSFNNVSSVYGRYQSSVAYQNYLLSNALNSAYVSSSIRSQPFTGYTPVYNSTLYGSTSSTSSTTTRFTISSPGNLYYGLGTDSVSFSPVSPYYVTGNW